MVASLGRPGHGRERSSKRPYQPRAVGFTADQVGAIRNEIKAKTFFLRRRCLAG